jgi:hypothetical protein
MFEKNDIVQIIDDTHSWYPALLIVDEVKSWGVRAFVVIPISNDNTTTPDLAFNRLKNEQIEKVGHVYIVRE